MSQLSQSQFPDAQHAFTELACYKGDLLLYSGVSFNLAAGQLLWLKGTNGVGKSTLLKQIAGLSRIDFGTVAWSAAITKTNATPLHYLGHENALDQDFSVEQSLKFWAQLFGAPKAAIDQAVSRLRLASFLQTPCRYLSSGQKRRTALARLVLDPRPVWLLDEPFVGLDLPSQETVTQLISDHLGQNGGAVLISHQDFAPLSSAAQIYTLEAHV